MTRVAVFFHRIGPYHFARLKAASQKLNLFAVEFSNVDTFYDWDTIQGSDGFERHVLSTDQCIESSTILAIYRRVFSLLSKIAPDVVALPGWTGATVYSAILWCRHNNVPVILMSETTAWDFQRCWYLETAKRLFLRFCSTALVGGTPHRKYLVRLGFDQNRIFLGYDSVDNEYFTHEAQAIRTSIHQTVIAKRYADPYFFSSARFVPKKNLAYLIESYSKYRALCMDRKPWDLVIAGNGPLLHQIISLIASLKLESNIHLPGFLQYHELPRYYAEASIFVHASTTEQWGLVVNEAMASGLPVLVSNRCGCALDLVKEGENGFLFDPNDENALARLMLQTSSTSFPLHQFARKGQQIVSKFGVQAFASGIEQAALCALSTNKSYASERCRIPYNNIIAGVGSCSNRGVDALVRSIYHYLMRFSPNERIALFSDYATDDISFLSDLQSLDVFQNPWGGGGRKFSQRIACKLSSTFGFNYGCWKITQGSNLWITGGDIFSEEYGDFSRFVYQCESAFQKGANIIVHAHSFGRFQEERSIDLIERLFKVAKFVSTRESASHDYIKELIGAKRISNRNVFMAADSAFLLPSAPFSAVSMKSGLDFERLGTYCCIVPSIGLHWFAGVSRNKHLCALSNLAICLANNNCDNVLILPHVQNRGNDNNDLLVAYDLIKLCNKKNIAVVDKQLNSSEFKALISRSQFVYTERMHPGIAALDCEVPLAVMGYSIKSEGILSDFFAGEDLNHVLLHKSLFESEEDLSSSVNLLFTSLDYYKHRIGENVQAVRQRALDGFEAAIAAIQAGERP
jgi:glycosyltransferase involved in cell wall biosynthesis/polysaccharide pyruvyl transferase WcaK-like protein